MPLSTDPRLAAIRSRRSAISPGGWSHSPKGAGASVYLDSGPYRGHLVASTWDGSIPEIAENAAFIGNAPDDIDYLLAIIEGLKKFLPPEP